MKRFILLGLVAVCGAIVAAAVGSQHTVSVTLNYDFTVDNACSSSVTTGCVKQFNIYDITGGGTPVKLFSIAAAGGAYSAVFMARGARRTLGSQDRCASYRGG